MLAFCAFLQFLSLAAYAVLQSLVLATYGVLQFPVLWRAITLETAVTVSHRLIV